MGDKAQRRLLTVLVLATFVGLQVPLKRLVREMIPGKRGPSDDVAEALVQGAARTAAVLLASTLVRALAGDRNPNPDPSTQVGGTIEEGTVKVTVDL